MAKEERLAVLYADGSITVLSTGPTASGMSAYLADFATKI